MNRYFIEVSYLGTNYSGFQVQQNAITIQSVVERALALISREAVSLTGSSRTDAGVHARQNFFHFDSGQEFSDRHVYNLNAVLPSDIAIARITKVRADAHCRFDATSRRYSYMVYRFKNPFIKDLGHFYPYHLNIEWMQAAAAIVAGTHDFSSFAKRNTQVKTFDCTIIESTWEVAEDRLVYRVAGNRFLRGMVRGLVGTMLKVGSGRQTVSWIEEVLAARDSRFADFSVPGHGLCLERVIYPAEMEIF